MTGSFLREPPVSPQVQALYDEDLADDGYVWNVSRLWAHQPDTLKGLFGLMSQAFTPSGLTFRQRGILVAAAASTLGDSYCSLAWGGKLAKATDADLAAGVLAGTDAGLTDQEILNSRRGTSADPRADVLLRFARTVVEKRGVVGDADIAAVRDAGYGDAEIAEVVAHVALNIFTNYFNNVAQTDLDFPKAPELMREAATV